MTTTPKPVYEAVAAVYAEGSTDQPGIMEYARPQDFATRKAWVYSVHEVEQEQPFPARFKLHLYVDVPLSASQTLGLAGQILSAGVPDYTNPHSRKPPMSPTDCLGEDDFWDETLGEPNICPDEDDNNGWPED